MKTIYITGCNGFIGSRLVQYFNKIPEYKVYGVQRGNNVQKNKTIYSDYNDVNFLKNVVKENCYVIHAAAFIPTSNNDSKETEVANNRITDFIIEAFKDKRVEAFFNLSSISVYGYGQKELINVIEEADILLTSYYSKSKYRSEILLSQNFQRNYNLRITSPFGTGKKNKTLLDLVIENVKNNEDVVIYGQGNRKQDFIWVEDIARVIYKMIERSVEPGDYNLGSGISLSVVDIISMLEDITKVKANVVSVKRLESPSVTISNRKLLDSLSIDKNFFTPFADAIKELLW